MIYVEIYGKITTYFILIFFIIKTYKGGGKIVLTIVIQVVVFAVYLLFMLLIGFGFYNTNNTLNDYFWAEEVLNKWVAAMSAPGI